MRRDFFFGELTNAAPQVLLFVGELEVQWILRCCAWPAVTK